MAKSRFKTGFRFSEQGVYRLTNVETEEVTYLVGNTEVTEEAAHTTFLEKALPIRHKLEAKAQEYWTKYHEVGFFGMKDLWLSCGVDGKASEPDWLRIRPVLPKGQEMYITGSRGHSSPQEVLVWIEL